MKKLFFFMPCLLAMLMSMTFVSCGDDNDDNSGGDNSKVVTENKTSTSSSPVYWAEDPTFSGKQDILEFVTSSKVIRREYNGTTKTFQGTYTFVINGSTISITGVFDESGKTQTVTATIQSWTDTKLVVVMQGETQTFTKITSLPAE